MEDSGSAAAIPQRTVVDGRHGGDPRSTRGGRQAGDRRSGRVRQELADARSRYALRRYLREVLMEKPHLYSSNSGSWQPHPTLPGIKVQSLENRASWSEASVTIVEVAPSGVIVEHLHETNFE